MGRPCAPRTARRVVAPHRQLPRPPWYFRGMAPTAARRAKLVQRTCSQGLQGNRDACHPRRGSACNINAKGTGGNARLVFALSVQPTAAMNPRIGGSRVGGAPRPFFSPISSGRNGGPGRAGPRREAGPPLAGRPQVAPTDGAPGSSRPTDWWFRGKRADTIRPYGLSLGLELGALGRFPG